MDPWVLQLGMFSSLPQCDVSCSIYALQRGPGARWNAQVGRLMGTVLTSMFQLGSDCFATVDVDFARILQLRNGTLGARSGAATPPYAVLPRL